MFFQTSNKQILDVKFIIIPTSILLISLGLCPKLRKLQSDHDLELTVDNEELTETTNGHVYNDETMSKRMSTASSCDGIGLVGKKRRKTWKDDTQRVIIESNTARGKAAIINSAFKIVLIPVCCVAVAHFMKVADVKHLNDGFAGFFADQTLMVMFFIQIASGFIGYELCVSLYSSAIFL